MNAVLNSPTALTRSPRLQELRLNNVPSVCQRSRWGRYTPGTAEPLGVSPPEAVDLFLIKPESKGRHHSIARQPAMGPLSGFVAGSSSWSSRPPAFARQVARSHRGWVRFTLGSRSFPGSRRPATWLRFSPESTSSPISSSSWSWGPWSERVRPAPASRSSPASCQLSWGPWSQWLRSCTESTS